MPVKLLRTFAACAGLLVVGRPVLGQLSPPTTGGVAELDLLLQRLAESRRVLVIGAHPDDEDTGLLTLLARGRGAAVAYLSLSRGEGGQNLIGSELGEALGLLRSRELLSAREVDGAQQFFTRAFDFGYTRSIDETFAHWPADSLLKDAVRVVRTFRPHVIVSIFSGTARDGHGQHQAAAITAQSAFDAAGDASRFPELERDEGLEPWVPLKFYRSTRFDTTGTTMSLETGSLDTRVGRSFHQIAMESRSRHRSQDMGQLQQIGPRLTRLRLIEDRTGDSSDGDILAGIDVPTSPLQRTADSLRRVLSPGNPAAIVPALAKVAGVGSGSQRELVGRALAIAAGIVLDGVSSDDEVVPGEAIDVELALFNGGPYDVTLQTLDVRAPRGWTVGAGSNGGTHDGEVLPAGQLTTRHVSLIVPTDASPTQPYFLERPRRGSMYDWSRVDPSNRGRPFQQPLVHVVASLELDGAVFDVSREVSFRVDDQANGEVRRELRVVPLVDVRIEPGRLVWPRDQQSERTVTVTASYNGTAAFDGVVQLESERWDVPDSKPIRLTHTGESVSLAFDLHKAPDASEGVYRIDAMVVGPDAKRYTQGMREVDYPHIRPTSWVEPSRIDVVLADMTLPAVTAVGYIRGAADEVPAALTSVGLPVQLLDGEMLARGDLSRFDAIIVGSRAYETDSALVRNNDRLLAYARSGGRVIVQYQQYAYVLGNFAPYPLTISRPHDRVTDETAPVRVLEPDHPIFRSPNAIGSKDWDGWPQERGLYFAGTWADEYRPLLEMSDRGGPPLRGGLLVAAHGAGTYIYTGLSFFRALPAGVPGAFRLLFNLIDYSSEHVP